MRSKKDKKKIKKKSVSSIIIVTLLVVVSVIIILIILNINKNLANEKLSEAVGIVDVTKNISRESHNFVVTNLTGKKVIIKNMSSNYSPTITGYIISSTKDQFPYNCIITLEESLTIPSSSIMPLEIECVPKPEGTRNFKLSLITEESTFINLFVPANPSAENCDE